MAGDAARTQRLQELLARQAGRAEALARERQVEEFARWHGARLAAAGVAFAVAWPWESPPAGPLEAYPFAVSGIRWERVPGAVQVSHDPLEVPADTLRSAFQALGVAADRRVHLAFDSASMPQLVLAAGDAATHLDELASWSSDLWIFDPGASWVIELYHEGRLAWAAKP